MHSILVFTLFLLIVSHEAISQTQDRKQLLLNDLDSLVSLIETCHVDPFHFITKNSFNSIVTNQKALITDSTTQYQFLHIINPILSSLRDGHSNLYIGSLNNDYLLDSGMVLPFKIKILNDQLLIKSEPQNKIPIGSEVIKINGVSASEIINGLKNLAVQEGEVEPYLIHKAELKFNLYLPSIVQIKEANEIELKEGSITYSGQQYDFNRTREALPDFSFHMHQGTPVLKIRSIGGGPFPGPLKKFMKKSMNKVAKSKYDQLIIDLRDNTGGNLNHTAEVLKYFLDKPFKLYDGIYVKNSPLTKRAIAKFGIMKLLLPLFDYPQDDWNPNEKYHKPLKKRHYDGRLVIITNAATFSAAASLVDYFKKEDIGYVVGEQYASSPDVGFGQNEYFILPFSRISGFISTWKYARGFSNDYFKIDKSITQDYSSLNDGKDIILEEAIKSFNTK